MEYPISQIAQILDLDPSEYFKTKISILLADSRQLFFPDETLFFALVTRNNDAHKYICDLYDKKVRNFVVSRMLPEWADCKDANFLLVEDALEAMQKIAAAHRSKFDIPVIGISGSNGKTIVKEWLYQTIYEEYKITRSPRSYNSQLGVPLSVWQINPNTELGIFEAGISKMGEMEKLEPIIRPTIGVLTNIGQAHQENFTSLEQKCLEKLKLFANCGSIICEEENETIKGCMETAGLADRRITWSREGSEKSFLHITHIDKKNYSTTIRFTANDSESEITIPFIEEASIEDALQVLAICLHLGVPISKIREKMSALETVAMRLDVRQGKNNCTLINDSYNSDFNSLSIALDFLVQRATDSKYKKTLILSDILQTGLDEQELYSMTAGLVAEKQVDLLVGIGAGISKFGYMFKNTKTHFFATTDSFIQSGFWREFHSMFILLKGARNFSFETINKILEEKTHETVLDVNLDAIVHNLKFYKSQLNPKTKIICMVKADGYGTGSTDVAKTLQYHKCDYLAVAVAEEGVFLRKEGITLPIIVLNAEVGGFDELVAYSLEPEVYNFRIFDAFIKEARLQGINDYPVHLKIDTGMNRLGFTAKDLPELEKRIKDQNGIRIHSIFSHLAASESWSFDDFTHEQISTFKSIATSIEKSCPYPVMKHILNSAGIERFPDEQMDMVRLGISLYGISASGLSGLKNVCTLKTTILQIKQIAKGETVGYGRKGQFDHNATIATIRIGYADGLSRQFGNGVGKVYVNGSIASIVGNVCMDLTMIDVTGIDVKEGDSVIIYGEELPIVEQAQRINTIPYEILTSISPRVKHIYFKE